MMRNARKGIKQDRMGNVTGWEQQHGVGRPRKGVEQRDATR